MELRNILAMVLSGGEGRRLYPLTKERAKPAVPFGGQYRIIDFVLSNLINSNFFKIKVLTQYMANSLIIHVERFWQLSNTIGHYIDIVPPQMRIGKHWFRGTADAIYQNLNLIFDEEPYHILVFAGDHIYKMDIKQMLEFHVAKDADLTIAAVPVPVKEANQFGIIEVDDKNRVIGFAEKPENPKTIPNNPKLCYASMGNYVFKRSILIDALDQDTLKDSSHDFGKDIIPALYKKARVFTYDFRNNIVPGMTESERGYWRDVGTIESYFETNMNLISIEPQLNLYNPEWPIRCAAYSYPPAKFVHYDVDSTRIGKATQSIVPQGCIISGGHIHKCILFPKVRINSYSYIEESILMEGVNVGRHSKIKRAIIDKGIQIPDKTEIGYDLEKDKKRFFVSDSGIVVVPKGYKF